MTLAVEMTTDKKRVSLYLEEDLKEAMGELAKRERRSLSNFIEVLCQETVERAIKEGKLQPNTELASK